MQHQIDKDRNQYQIIALEQLISENSWARVIVMYSVKYILYWILSGFTFGEKMKKYSTQMNESKFKEIYHQYKSSGLPKEEFCKVYGYTKSTFYC